DFFSARLKELDLPRKFSLESIGNRTLLRYEANGKNGSDSCASTQMRMNPMAKVQRNSLN
ncbi:MAG: hypothetical protein ACREUM_03385, partial [Nitrosospira sp.]